MKQFRNAILQVIGFLLVFLATILFLAWITSCSALRPIEQRPDFQIEFEDSCYTILPTDEDLLTPNINDCLIVDISRNKKKYIVLDGLGHNTYKVREYPSADSNMIGERLICRNEFR